MSPRQSSDSPRRGTLDDMDPDITAMVCEVIEQIPEGRVATYGDIAKLSGAPSARIVGRILSHAGHDLPWQRVIRADGTCAPHLANEQLALLGEEGVPAIEGKVDLSRYRWEETNQPIQETSERGLWD